jgi:hypothetical protein
MQLVTLSNRPAVVAETVDHLRHFLPWLDRVVVVAPRRAHDEMAAALDGHDVALLGDEDLAAAGGVDLGSLDHMERNYTLRGALAGQPSIDEVFLMADDDHRPLKAVDESFFRDGDRHRGYFFYDLVEWPGTSTPFDIGQHQAGELLRYLGYDHLAYGSHMPQLIRKEHLAEAWEVAARLTPSRSICEWSLYFNVSRARHPEAYCEPAPFRTMCWPQYANEWPWWVAPPEYVFENFYPELYAPGHLFDGLPTALDPGRVERDAVEKIMRWSALGRRTAQLDFTGGVADPWTKGSPVRRGAFGILRRLRQAYGYVAGGDRARLTELTGTVRRLEDEVRRLRDTGR